jgi:hypothetical protein
VIHPKYPDPSVSETGKMGQPGKFCEWCGRHLIETRFLDHYDSRTGKPRYATRNDCPLVLRGPPPSKSDTTPMPGVEG